MTEWLYLGIAFGFGFAHYHYHRVLFESVRTGAGWPVFLGIRLYEFCEVRERRSEPEKPLKRTETGQLNFQGADIDLGSRKNHVY